MQLNCNTLLKKEDTYLYKDRNVKIYLYKKIYFNNCYIFLI